MKRLMAFAYTTRRGKMYYLHTGPKRGGGVQHYVSTDPKGPVAEAVPEGFEINETPNGQVYLCKRIPALIQPTELALVERELKKCRPSQHCYLAEISDEKIIIHEGDTHIDTLREINMWFSTRGLEEYAVRSAHYVPVMRFVLQDRDRRVFAPERYCFRSSVEVVTNLVPQVVERASIVYVTNAASGAVSGYATREPVATNMVTALVTNFVPVFYTNLVQVPVTMVPLNGPASG